MYFFLNNYRIYIYALVIGEKYPGSACGAKNIKTSKQKVIIFLFVSES